ncbi:carboxypeptidase regulatory-like domain-containing protein, partial [Thermodesulfobacteriota bacterium]
ETLNIAQKCTGCAHLLDDGWTEPRCADACPTDAIVFGEESELKDLIERAELLYPESMTRPRVYYIGLPRKFVGGTVYDPVEKEVVIGATCTLKEQDSGDTVTVNTDNFGDFWFKGLEDDRLFNLTIERNGKTKTIDTICTEKDVNLGDVPFP